MPSTHSSRKITRHGRITREDSRWLRAVVEGLNVRVKSSLAYERLTWQGLGNVSIHFSLVWMVAYAICIAAYGIGRPELRQGVAFFA